MQALTSYPAIVGRILEQKRKNKNLEQANIADYLEISQSAWSRIERGQTGLSIEYLVKVCELLEVEPHEILHDADRARRGLLSKGILVSAATSSSKDAAAFLGLAALAALIVIILRKK